MYEIFSPTVSSITEQDGPIEREFKYKIKQYFAGLHKPIRAYLTHFYYSNSSQDTVNLLLRIVDPYPEAIINEIAKIFKSMFASNQFLDMMLITDEQEQVIRRICCPFYTSQYFQVEIPDFYLFSTEGYRLNDMPRRCYKRTRLHGNHSDGYMLCDIDPVIIGQPFGLGDKDINQVIFAGRFTDMTLFPIREWPSYVHVARILINDIELKEHIQPNDIESIAWAELYQYEHDIKTM